MQVSYEQAISIVREKISRGLPQLMSESVPLEQACGRVLAEDILADRPYPPFHRAIRDGYAVRATDVARLPALLECLGEVRAGRYFQGQLGPGQCVAIMTGAPLPPGADAVVMVEHTQVQFARAGSASVSREIARAGGADQVRVLRPVGLWENVVLQGSEAAAGARVLARGRRLAAAELGLLAMVGRACLTVFRQPAVAILPTGDEVVPIEQAPEWFQIRNSNAVALAAQVASAGGVPKPLDISPDREERLRELIEEGLRSDLLLLSGGVSIGKYDLVEHVLSGLGGEFYFQGVAMRPGKPLVFGRVQEKFFFGLPGNPVSTFVTFELFVRPAIVMLGGGAPEPPVSLRARLSKPFRQNPGLSAFLPARVQVAHGEPVVELVGWQGSGDLVGLGAANCLLVVPPDKTDLAPGDWVDVMPRG
jgi:molybdopterin molybdotransferase